MVILVLAACVGLQAVPDGTDSAPVSFGGLTISHAAVDFGSVTVGDEATESLVLTSEGSTAARVEVALTGAGFAADKTEITVLKLGEEVVSLSFAPEEVAEYAGELTLSVAGESLVVPLSGSGTDEWTEDTGDDTDAEGGELSTDVPSLAFGSLDVDDSSMKSVTVSNTGTAALTVDSATSSDTAFVLGGNLTPPRTLDPGESRVIEVVFTPTTEKSYNAELTLVSDDPTSPRVKIAMSGTGINECDICGPLIEVDTGGSSDYSLTDFLSFFGSTDSRTISIGNDGDEDLEVRSIDVNNDFLATCGTFWLSSWGGSATVKPGKSTSFTLNYKATEACLDVSQKSLDANVVHINSNDKAEPDYIIEIGGTGVFL